MLKTGCKTDAEYTYIDDYFKNIFQNSMKKSLVLEKNTVLNANLWRSF
jgi:hypothetical protein